MFRETKLLHFKEIGHHILLQNVINQRNKIDKKRFNTVEMIGTMTEKFQFTPNNLNQSTTEKMRFHVYPKSFQK